MAARPTHALRINAIELLRQPGAVRRIAVALAPADLDIDDRRITGDVEIDLTATSGIDGIVIEGEINVPWTEPCRRCLTAVEGVTDATVNELYQYDITDDEAFQIVGDQIDLAPAIREYVLLDLPDGPVCRDDCAGICAQCGTDLNRGSCDCDTTVRDDRWAALDTLRLGDDA